jgi:hypothetical protein
MESYSGYLAVHTSLIRTLHEGGASTRAIAEALYDAGARASTSSPSPAEMTMTRDEHIANLHGMTYYVLQCLGLRTRRIRILNLRANKTKEASGVRPDASQNDADADDTTMETIDAKAS